MKKIFPLLILLLLFTIYSYWFIKGTLSSGDWVYKYRDSFSSISIYPTIWDPLFGDKIGGNAAFLMPLNTYYVNSIYLFVSALQIPWEIYERIIWYIPFIIISFCSAKKLFKQIFPNDEIGSWLAGFLYTTNSYILMVVGGGQIAVGMSIALMPLVLSMFLNTLSYIQKKDVQNGQMIYLSLMSGIVLSLQLMFDLRFTYISICTLFLLFIIHIGYVRSKKMLVLAYAIIPSLIMIFLHAFWLLAFIKTGNTALQDMGSSYSSVDALKFFSVSKIENTIGLMHPYWPENIFGKVGFMKPEFLIYPLFAFASLLFIPYKKSYEKNIILYFALIALIGIFFAKGSNDPFGILYVWLFEHFPGFSMFRDPTKWYTLIALSYSILIPYSLFTIQRFIRNKYQSKVYKDIFLLLMIFLLVFPIRVAIMGQLSGTFKPQIVPQEYKTLSNFISSQPDYFRTLWIPTSSNLAYSTYNHPRMAGGVFLKESDNKKITEKLAKNRKMIEEASIKYVIIPYATRGEIFQTERKYDRTLYESTVKAVRTIPWLKEKEGFGNLKVFQVADYKPHIWRQNDSENNVNSITFINPTHYDAAIYNGKKGDTVIFSESYDPKWYMQTPYGTVFSKKYGMLNSFQLPEDGTYEVSLLYAPQKYVIWGTWISAISLVIVLSSIIYLKRKI